MSTLATRLKPFEEAARSMQGWRFAYLPESVGEKTPWDYVSRAADLAKSARTVIDLGTGGGETYLDILGSSSCIAFATEAWEPNVAVAAANLGTLATLTRCCSETLPFADDSFDLVLARHEAIEPEEIVRVLAPGGRFLSQQVIPDFMHELSSYFPDCVVFPDFIASYRQGFTRLGAEVTTSREHRYQIRFNELGHLVYQLTAAPWTVPGFTVESHLAGLQQLETRMQAGDDLVFSAGYCLLEVENPG